MTRRWLVLLSVSALMAAATVSAWVPSRLVAQTGPARPKITGVAGIAIKAKDRAASRTFYSTVLGLDEAFLVKNAAGGSALTTFKINDRQYVYVAPDLKDDTESRLLFVSYETS